MADPQPHDMNQPQNHFSSDKSGLDRGGIYNATLTCSSTDHRQTQEHVIYQILTDTH